MIERLVLTSLTESIPLETELRRRGRTTSLEFERAIALFEKHFGATGPVHIAGSKRSAVCTGSTSSEASGAAKRCSGRIALLGDTKRALPGTEIRFEAHRGRGRGPGSLTLTCNPSRLLTGTDAHPTSKDSKSGQPLSYPSTSHEIMWILSEFPFEIVAAVNNNAYSIDSKKIRIRRMEWMASLPCSDPNSLLEVLAIAFGLVISAGG